MKKDYAKICPDCEKGYPSTFRFCPECAKLLEDTEAYLSKKEKEEKDRIEREKAKEKQESINKACNALFRKYEDIFEKHHSPLMDGPYVWDAKRVKLLEDELHYSVFYKTSKKEVAKELLEKASVMAKQINYRTTQADLKKKLDEWKKSNNSNCRKAAKTIDGNLQELEAINAFLNGGNFSFSYPEKKFGYLYLHKVTMHCSPFRDWVKANIENKEDSKAGENAYQANRQIALFQDALNRILVNSKEEKDINGYYRLHNLRILEWKNENYYVRVERYGGGIGAYSDYDLRSITFLGAETKDFPTATLISDEKREIGRLTRY